MYIGSTGSRGLHHMLWEIVDNSIDEAMAGFATRVDVTLGRDGSVTVQDNGRGMPVDIHPTHGRIRRGGDLHQAARGRQV